MSEAAMREDDCRVREIHARENLAVLRHIAMSRLKNDSTKLGIKNKSLQTGWDERYLGKLLFGTPRTAGQNAPSGDPIIAAVYAIALLPWSTGLTNQSRRRSPIRRSSDQNDTAAPEYLSKADSLPKDTAVGVFKNKLLDCASIVCAEEWKA